MAQQQWSAASPPPVAGYSPRKWEDFVERGGMEKTRFFKYYLGDSFSIRSWRDWKVEDWEKAFAGLFADAVTIGAIGLPSPYTADDFQFKMEEGGGALYISLKNDPEMKGTVPVIVYFDQKTTMGVGSGDITNAIRELTAGVNDIFCKLTGLDLTELYNGGPLDDDDEEDEDEDV